MRKNWSNCTFRDVKKPSRRLRGQKGRMAMSYSMADTKNGEKHTLEGYVSFEQNEKQYGNGVCMVVEGLGEPFGEQGYDIRYDTDFHKKNPIQYIADWYTNKFSAQRFVLTGMSISEAE